MSQSELLLVLARKVARVHFVDSRRVVLNSNNVKAKVKPQLFSIIRRKCEGNLTKSFTAHSNVACEEVEGREAAGSCRWELV